MASKSYIPNRDADFKLWSATLVTVLGEDALAYGVTPAQITALTGAAGPFNDAYDAHLDAQTAAKAASMTKDNTRKEFTDVIRGIVRQIQANPAVTDAQKIAIGITVPKDSKTPSVTPTSYPIPQIEDIETLEHILRVVDSDADHKAKPDGVRGAEVWMKIVSPGAPAPVDPSELELVDITSTSKITQSFNGDTGGKTAYYRLRWVSTRNEKGPWGPQVSATIAA